MTEAFHEPSDDDYDYAAGVVHEVVMDSFVKPGMEATEQEVALYVDSEAVLEGLLSNVRIVGNPEHN